ncbi:hypothetical protein SpCBS45565_g01124 [Spizellomyces sp. 'palustris']|nr:hypothetical protein SpCBS45565_g01124 [Spizellomyces sp. 'palustris']
MSTDVLHQPTQLSAVEERNKFVVTTLRRDREIKEQKLAAQRRTGAFQEEEVSIFEGNLKEARQLYEQQLIEQRLVQDRQREAAADLISCETRKRELIAMVLKIAAFKTHATQQDQARERELDFRAKQKQKREAFEKRTKTIQVSQVTERSELIITQERIARNLKMVHTLEMRGLGEVELRGRAKEYELQYQQLAMRQQKEAEQLRELQLIKLRHMSEQMELDLLSSSDLEDLLAEQTLKENTLLATQTIERSNEVAKLDRQQAQLKALQLKEEQKTAQAQLISNQNRQRRGLDRNQKASARIRERGIIDETSAMMAEVGNSFHQKHERDVDNQSSFAGTSEVDTSDMVSSTDGGGMEHMEHDLDESEIQAIVQGSEADRKRKQRSNKDAATELLEALEKGQERLAKLEAHNKELYESLKVQHKDQRNQKVRELKRKQASLLKEQEEEVQTIRAEQATDMEELFDMIKKYQELHAEQTALLNGHKPEPEMPTMKLAGNTMPPHFASLLKSGQTPLPTTYDNAVTIRTALAGPAQYTAKQMIQLLQRLYAIFDDIIAKCEGVYQVESVADGYILCVGLTDTPPSPSQITDAISKAITCAQQLIQATTTLSTSDLGIQEPINLKVGIHCGKVKAGFVGSRVPHFRVLGDTVDKASRLCAGAQKGGILVSNEVESLVGDRYRFEKNDGGNGFWVLENVE